MEKYKFSVKTFIFIVIFLSFIVSAFSFTGILIKNSKLIEKNITSLKIDTKESRDQTIKNLTNLLNERRFLSKNQQLTVLKMISTTYLINFDYINGLEYAIETIYLSKKLGDNMTCASVLIDLSNVFSDLGAYDIAEDSIKHALSLQFDNENDRNAVNLYANINLAELYSKTYRTKEALETIEVALNYTNPKRRFHQMDLLSLSLSKARSLFYEGKVSEAKSILADIEKGIHEIENNPVFNDINLAFNLQIPYLSLISQIQISEGYISKGIESSKELFELCDLEGSNETKRTYMNSILRVLQISSTEDSIDEIKLFETEMLKELNNMINNKNHIFVDFIINSCEAKFDVMDSKETQLKVVIKFIFIILALSIILVIVSVYARNSKIQTEIDELTQIYNRRKFNLDYKKSISTIKNLGLLIIDIDHFKAINDDFGHDFGDIVLKELSSKIKTKLSKNEDVFRYGGEEFCVLCRDRTLDEVVKIAEVLRFEIEHMPLDNNISVTISLGVAHSKQTNDIFKLADNNLYKSKESGRNKVTYTDLP
ncbi:diguanylate cyclase (GGDEF) domain-containing protein [Clostridium collagenovorans DSM 3089]|uniref:Diguanylate cyclase (GGDEF) domain-containing protein n=1 Tax=Clostridium collagenovorans DSM 3089 TaxID=1121306 RepID=A0A1M5VBJ6_9CLOT|nr:GGDEF domain-containing protein [Clostridium collagenovorans]SHH72581.1 diguanylate cyclase (GGDEF) domain-containing protein [Clostridium collagenovorans DSM 3089]